MDILLVVATAEEAQGIDFPELERSTPHSFELLLAGVGIAATTYSLAKKLSAKNYDLAINIGLAGSFKDEYKVGDVVVVESDCFADLGAEDDEKFLSLDQLKLMDKNVSPFTDGRLAPKMPQETGLKRVAGITVNKVHGSEKSIQQVKSIFNPDIESMEGAAFFYVCMLENIPCIQLRAISNKVEKRNRDAWDIPLALKNLSQVFNNLIQSV